MRPLAVAFFILACGIEPAIADGPGPLPRLASPAPEQLILAVTVNTVPRGDLFATRLPDGSLQVRLDDLRALGLRIPDGAATAVRGESLVTLGSVQGLRHELHLAQLKLDLTADPALLPVERVDLYARQRAHLAKPGTPTAFFNYALQAGTLGSTSGAQYSLDYEGGARLGSFLLESNATTMAQPGQPTRTVRLLTRATRDDVDSLQRLTIGDFYSAAGELGTSAGLGGISLSKQYGLDPYALRQPLSNLRTQIALPSDVEVLVDGQRVRLDRVQPGEFQLQNLYGYGGSRDVQVLVRDAFGRVQQLDYSVYFTDQPLRQGLHEYSYGAGLLRRNYGLASNDYGAPAFSFFHRYGWTDAVTLGVRAEGRREARNAGVSGTFVLGSLGVLGASSAWSSAAGVPGWSAGLNYTYQRREFSAAASLRRTSRVFGTLVEPLSIGNRRQDATLTASYHLGGLGTFSLSRSVLSVYDPGPLPAGFASVALPPQQATTLAYTVPLVSGRANLWTSVSRIRDNAGRRTDLNARVTVYFERDQILQAAVRHADDGQVDSLRYTRSVPVGVGAGYDAEVLHASGQGGEALQLRLSSQLNTPQATVRVEAERSRSAGVDQDGARVTLAGGIAFIGGHAYLSRPLTDGFGLVRTGKLAGVPVALNGMPMGETDASGQLLLPNLNSYIDNEISIDQNAVPIDYAVPQLRLRMAPLYRSGVVADFPATRVQALSAHLVRQENGQRKPLELVTFSLEAGGKTQHGFSGRSGEIYLENLPAGTYTGHADSEPPCTFELRVPSSNESFLQLGDVPCR